MACAQADALFAMARCIRYLQDDQPCVFGDGDTAWAERLLVNFGNEYDVLYGEDCGVNHLVDYATALMRRCHPPAVLGAINRPDQYAVCTIRCYLSAALYMAVMMQDDMGYRVTDDLFAQGLQQPEKKALGRTVWTMFEKMGYNACM